MRIGIDYTAAVRQRAGIGRYTRNLVRALGVIDTENQYRLFVAGGWGSGGGLVQLPANFRRCGVPISDRWMNIIWQRLHVPIPVQWITGGLDLFHSPDFVLPPSGRIPTVLTVHDLSFLRVPECFVPEFLRYLEGAVRRAVSRARYILADSHSTRRDLIELMGVETHRVRVIHPGVEARFQPVADTEALAAVRHRYNLPAKFVLGLGTLQPRKNTRGLIAAFARLAGEATGTQDLADLHLVLAGEKGWMYDDTFAEVRRAGLEGRALFCGYVEDADLPALYSLARVFAFPSLYEGFGLPALEAMACGTPVVAADNSSLPEVVGQAGLLVPAQDCDALAGAMARLATDEALRAHFIAAGREQARKFTWEAAAAELLDVYLTASSGDSLR